MGSHILTIMKSTPAFGIFLLLVSPSCLATPTWPETRGVLQKLGVPMLESDVGTGRIFTEEPIINYFAWGLLAGFAKEAINPIITPLISNLFTTTAAPSGKNLVDEIELLEESLDNVIESEKEKKRKKKNKRLSKKERQERRNSS